MEESTCREIARDDVGSTRELVVLEGLVQSDGVSPASHPCRDDLPHPRVDRIFGADALTPSWIGQVERQFEIQSRRESGVRIQARRLPMFDIVNERDRAPRPLGDLAEGQLPAPTLIAKSRTDVGGKLISAPIGTRLSGHGCGANTMVLRCGLLPSGPAVSRTQIGMRVDGDCPPTDLVGDSRKPRPADVEGQILAMPRVNVWLRDRPGAVHRLSRWEEPPAGGRIAVTACGLRSPASETYSDDEVGQPPNLRSRRCRVCNAANPTEP